MFIQCKFLAITTFYHLISNCSYIDTCTFVEKESRQQCENDDTSADKCRQLGCCYEETEDSSVPKCFLNPSKKIVFAENMHHVNKHKYAFVH